MASLRIYFVFVFLIVMFIIEAHQFLMIICYDVDRQTYSLHAQISTDFLSLSMWLIAEAHHMPKYQQASHRAPSSAPPGRGNQGCRQNLSSKFHLIKFS